jgi:hypothetical protein
MRIDFSRTELFAHRTKSSIGPLSAGFVQTCHSQSVLHNPLIKAHNSKQSVRLRVSQTRRGPNKLLVRFVKKSMRILY